MRRGPLLLAALAAVTVLVLTIALSRDGGSKVDADCVRFCVTAVEEDGDVVRFDGRGWLAGRPVDAGYGEICPRTGFCSDEGFGRTLRVDGRGRFSFHLRTSESSRRVDVPGGRLPVRFEQWRGRPFQSDLVRRRVPSP